MTGYIDTNLNQLRAWIIHYGASKPIGEVLMEELARLHTEIPQTICVLCYELTSDYVMTVEGPVCGQCITK